MKKSSVQLRKDIVKLQEQLRQAETREAERIGRLALKAGRILPGVRLRRNRSRPGAPFSQVSAGWLEAVSEPAAAPRPFAPPVFEPGFRFPWSSRNRLATASTSSDARKKDTREKIELGGLIVKAGLRFEKRALLLGALIELQQRLAKDQNERDRLIAIGSEAFRYDGE